MKKFVKFAVILIVLAGLGTGSLMAAGYFNEPSSDDVKKAVWTTFDRTQEETRKRIGNNLAHGVGNNLSLAVQRNPTMAFDAALYDVQKRKCEFVGYQTYRCSVMLEYSIRSSVSTKVMTWKMVKDNGWTASVWD